jgi:hypothetical protein
MGGLRPEDDRNKGGLVGLYAWAPQVVVLGFFSLQDGGMLEADPH